MSLLLCTLPYFATRARSGIAAMASSPLLLWPCVFFCSCYCLVALGDREHGFLVVPASSPSASQPACSSVSHGIHTRELNLEIWSNNSTLIFAMLISSYFG